MYRFGLLICILFGSFSLSSQTNYYVSPTGNNNNNSGTATDQAWQTIQYAMDNASPNSMVNILAGTYNEKVEVNISGTEGNPIIFTNYQNDEVIVDGSGITSLEAIIGIFDQSYVHIDGLKIRNNLQTNAQGIIVEGDCQGIEIKNNEISEIHFSSNPSAPVNETTNSQPLIVYGTDGTSPIRDLVVSGNTVRDSRTGFSEGLAINGNVEGFVVQDNRVYNITNIGIDIIGHEGTSPSNDQARNGFIAANLVYNCKSPYATAAGIYVDGGKDLIIEGNEVYNCQWGIEIGCENLNKTTSNVIVRSNFIYNNDDAGIAMGGYDYPSNSGKVINSKITNNSCYANDKSNSGIGGVTGEINLTYTENCTIENNIFYADNPAGLMLYQDPVNSQNLVLNYNLYFPTTNIEYDFENTNYANFSLYKSGTSQDSQSINVDPLLVNTAEFDLHLSNGSPGINMGNPSYDNVQSGLDIDGETRVIDGRIEVGADEYFLSTNAHIFTEINSLTIFPNPFTDKVFIDGDISDYTIQVLNEAGMVVYDFSGSTNPLEIGLNLGAGLFFLYIKHNTLPVLSIQKIVKM